MMPLKAPLLTVAVHGNVCRDDDEGREYAVLGLLLTAPTPTPSPLVFMLLAAWFGRLRAFPAVAGLVGAELVRGAPPATECC